MYTTFEYHADNNVLVRSIKHFCRSSNFTAYIRTHIQWFVEPCRRAESSKGLSKNNFCHAYQILSIKQPPPITPLFLTDNIKMEGMPNKSFEGTSYKNLWDTVTRTFNSCCFILAFTSTDIIFHKCLKLHSTLSKKGFSPRIFHF